LFPPKLVGVDPPGFFFFFFFFFFFGFCFFFASWCVTFAPFSRLFLFASATFLTPIPETNPPPLLRGRWCWVGNTTLFKPPPTKVYLFGWFEPVGGSTPGPPTRFFSLKSFGFLLFFFFLPSVGCVGFAGFCFFLVVFVGANDGNWFPPCPFPF